MHIFFPSAKSSAGSRARTATGDGRPDMLVGAANGRLYSFQNHKGTGGQPSGRQLAQPTFAPFDGDSRPASSIYLAGYSHPFLYDFDGDGDDDLLVGASDDRLHYFANTPAADGIARFFEAQIPVRGIEELFDRVTVRLQLAFAFDVADARRYLAHALALSPAQIFTN